MSWVAVAALGCAASIAMGAFGAHGLRSHLDPEALALWETAARYLMYGSLGLLAISIYDRVAGGGTATWSAPLLSAGVVVFAVTVASLALGGPRWLGAITPIGGSLMITGFLVFGWVALKH